MERDLADAREIFIAAVRAVQPDRLLSSLDLNTIAGRPLADYGHLFVVGMGKASLAMASTLEQIIKRRISDGCVAVPAGYEKSLPALFPPPSHIEVAVGGHPLPNEGSAEAARRILHLAEKADRNDLVLALISGGGSACCTDFAEGVSLEDARSTFQTLLESGMDIHAMNAVRKHLSTIGGGRLAAAAYPADVAALVISDVVGDNLSSIASGPTAPDPSTYEDALGILHDSGRWNQIPTAVRTFFLNRRGDAGSETPKADSSLFDRVANHVVGSNGRALQAAADTAAAKGYTAHILARDLVGEAREIGAELVQRVVSRPVEEPTCFLSGGETTVTIRGHGRGGRNQELALSAAIALEGVRGNVALLSGGTDGIDGPTDAAGAVVSNRTAERARTMGRDPTAYLDDNDSYGFFEQQGGLVRTGPTHTNVMDIQVIIRHQ